jgi:DNA-directed RNA polymerase I subunit RPA1
VVGHLTAGKAPMTLTAACKTSEKYWGKTAGEETLIFYRGELLTGTMDKAQYGKYGLVHAVQVPSPPPPSNY